MSTYRGISIWKIYGKSIGNLWEIYWKSMGNMVENTMPLRSFKATFQVNWIRFTFLRNTWPFFGISANFRYTAVFNNGTCQQYPDAPWCWNIYLHDWPKFLAVNLGKYSSTMVRIWVIGYMMLGFSMRFPVIAPRTIPRTLQKKSSVCRQGA